MKRKITGRILRGILLINGIVLLLTCSLFFVYEYSVFRDARIDELSSISRIISSNASAALAFHDAEAAQEILGALQRSPDITVASLYDERGVLFASFPDSADKGSFPPVAGTKDFTFLNDGIEGFQPVMLGEKKIGTLFLRGNLDALYERLLVYAMLAVAILVFSSFVTYVLYKVLKSRMLREVELQTQE